MSPYREVLNEQSAWSKFKCRIGIHSWEVVEYFDRPTWAYGDILDHITPKDWLSIRFRCECGKQRVQLRTPTLSERNPKGNQK